MSARVELVERVDADAGLELRAVLLEQRDHRAADRRRAALGDRPAVGVRGRAERDPDRRRHRRREGPERVRGDAGQQGPRLRRGEARLQQRGRQPGVQAEAGHQQRVIGHAQHRAHEVGGDVAEALGERTEQPPPRARRPRRGRRPSPRPSGTPRRPRRRRADGRTGSPASATSVRAPRGRSAARTACRAASGCAAEHSSWTGPAASARCCACRRRARSAASSTVTSTPSAARVSAAASPLGPLPTTIAARHAVTGTFSAACAARG